jgi:site-specific DNA recombinase
MMQDAKDGKFDMIAVWKIDRLSRNLSHLLSTFELLQSYKVGFFSHKENIDFTGPIGKLTFQIFGALAEFERETIKTRTKEGKITSARFGNYVMHNTPYGYQKESLEKKRNRSLTIIEEEKVWVNRIFEEYI